MVIPLMSLEKQRVVLVHDCPKCGGIPIWRELFGSWSVSCAECGFIGAISPRLIEAVEQWNEIPSELPIPEAEDE